MAIFNGPPALSDWLKGESDTANKYSRDQVTVAAGNGVLSTGTVLGQITASGKWTLYDPANSDGSQSLLGILIDPVDTTNADQPSVIIARHAVISHNALVWKSTVNTALLRAAGVALLKGKGIIDRQTA